MKRIFTFLLAFLLTLPCYAVWVHKNDTSGNYTLTDGSTDAITVDSSGNMVTGALLDVNGVADGLVIDADGDTTISAPTDDQIDIEISSADDFTFTANTFNVLSGSSILNAGLIDLNGVADSLVVDADADTTISAPTDDQIDIELKSVDHVVLKAVAAADGGATTNIAEIAFTTPVDTTGSNTHQGLVIDAEIGNATGGTNVVNLFEIDAITGDAEVTLNAINVGALTGTGATETALTIGTGWDSTMSLSGGVVVAKDNASADSGATNDVFEIAFTTPVDTTGSNTHNAMTIDLAIGNATGGTNVVNGLEIDGITADADVTENAINIGTGWDKVMTASWTSASTAAGTSVESMVVDQTMTGAGGVGGRARFQLNVDAGLGGWANALKALTDFNSGGSVTGLGSAFVAELNLSTGTTSGTYAPLEAELTLDSGASTGTATSFLYANVTDDSASYNTNGYFFELGSGVVDTASGMFDSNAKAGIGMTHTLRIRVGGTTYYLPLHTSANFGGS